MITITQGKATESTGLKVALLTIAKARLMLALDDSITNIALHSIQPKDTQQGISMINK
jgi:hypothetical protein